ncbi:twin-arginine translocation pathway signal [Mycolicibacterium sp. P9-64]|nr:twin-arginine translocation pathway signal [Mycolicibacterium sp. P9-64]
MRRQATLITSCLILTISSAVAAMLYVNQYRSDERTTFADGRSVAAAAEGATVALLSYKPESLDADMAAAKAHLTGEFLTYYSQFSDEIAAPAAKQKGIVTTAAVVRSAVADLQPTKASVLLFVNQTTTSRERPEPSQTASSVMVTMTEVAGRWLISSFDPV